MKEGVKARLIKAESKNKSTAHRAPNDKAAKRCLGATSLSPKNADLRW